MAQIRLEDLMFAERCITTEDISSEESFAVYMQQMTSGDEYCEEDLAAMWGWLNKKWANFTTHIKKTRINDSSVSQTVNDLAKLAHARNAVQTAIKYNEYDDVADSKLPVAKGYKAPLTTALKMGYIMLGEAEASTHRALDLMDTVSLAITSYTGDDKTSLETALKAISKDFKEIDTLMTTQKKEMSKLYKGSGSVLDFNQVITKFEDVEKIYTHLDKYVDLYALKPIKAIQDSTEQTSEDLNNAMDGMDPLLAGEIITPTAKKELIDILDIVANQVSWYASLFYQAELSITLTKNAFDTIVNQ